MKPSGTQSTSFKDLTLQRVFSVFVGSDKVLSDKTSALLKEFPDPQLADFIDKIISPMTEKIILLTEEISYCYVNVATILKSNQAYVEMLTKAILLSAASNIAKLRNCRQGELHIACLKFLMEFFYQEFSDKKLQEQFDSLDAQKNEEGLKLLFQPSVNKFLTLILPECVSVESFTKEWVHPHVETDSYFRKAVPGTKVYETVYYLIQQGLLPGLFVDVYRFLIKPSFAISEFSVRFCNPGGECIEDLLDLLRPLLAEFIGGHQKRRSGEEEEEGFTAVPVISKFLLETFRIEPAHPLCPWVTDWVRQVFLVDDEPFKFLWNALGSNVSAALKRGFYEILLKNDPECRDNPLITLVNFWTPQLQTFLELPDDGQLSNSLQTISLFLLNIVSLKEWAPSLHKLACGLLPDLLIEIYRSFHHKLGQRQQLLQKVADCFYDQQQILRCVDKAPKNIVLYFRRMTHIANLHPEEAARLRMITGSTFLAMETGHIADLVAAAVVEHSSKFLKREGGDIADKVFRWLDLYQNGEMPQRKAAFVEMITYLGPAGHQEEAGLQLLLRKQLSLLILKGVLNALGTQQLTGLFPVEFSYRFLDLLVKHGNGLNERIARSEKPLPLLYPLAGDLLQWIFPNMEEEIPLSPFLQATIARTLRNYVLPKMLLDWHEDLTRWIKRSPHLLQRLAKVFESGRPGQAVGVLNYFIADFIPYFLYTRHQRLGTLLAGNGIELIDHLSLDVPQGRHTALFLSANRKHLADKISENILHFSTHNLEMARKASGMISAYSGSLVLTIATWMAENMAVIDSISLREKIVLQTTEIAASHFNELGRIKEKYGVQCLSKLPLSKVYEEFDPSLLHPGMPIRDEDQDEVRLQHFFNRFADKLLVFAAINDKEPSPFPSLIDEQCSDLLREELLPQILLGIFEGLRRPGFIDAALKGWIKSSSEEAPTIEADERYKQAMDKCIAALVRFLPEKLMVRPLRWSRVQNSLAAGSAEGAQRLSCGSTVLQLVKTLITETLPSLHEGKWEGDEFIPMQVIIDRNGKVLRERITRPVFYYPNTPEGLVRAAELEKEKEKRDNEELLGTLADKVIDALFRFAASLWVDHPAIQSLREKLTAALKKLLQPLIKLVRLLLAYFIKDYGKQAVAELHHPVHESLFYRVADRILDILIEEKLKVCA